MRLIEVYNTFSPADAHLVCSSLQSAGFDSRVTNEIATLTLEGYALASGGIRVMVPEAEFDEARALIEQQARTPNDTEMKRDSIRSATRPSIIALVSRRTKEGGASSRVKRT